jgi:D-apionolactonase
MTRRAILLTGTAEAVTPMRRLSCGSLSADLDGGNLRYIRWCGVEVLRGIAFVIRDTQWGTYRPTLASIEIAEEPHRFAVSYMGSCEGSEGSFCYRARIVGSSDGRVRFSAEGRAPHGFATNRAGFVVLHGLDGVVSRPLRITQTGGAVTDTSFPALVQPHQPATDIASLNYTIAAGIEVAVSLEGEAFEMEDQRNWTDASFKTYVRPLSLGYPYRIEAGETLRQAVELFVTGHPQSAAAITEGAVTLQWGGDSVGTMPELGLYVDSTILGEAMPHAAAIKGMESRFLQARVDFRGPNAVADLDRAAALAEAIGSPLALDLVIQGRDPRIELAPLGEWLHLRRPPLAMVFAIPERDLPGGDAGPSLSDQATAEDILAEARRVAPNARIVGGSPVGFPELNRNRPSGVFDVITHATQAIVHAADDISVMETLSAIRHVIRTARSFSGTASYRVGPATIGMPPSASANAPRANPTGRRLPMALEDPRQTGLFAASFLVGYVDEAEGVEALTLAAPVGASGLLESSGAWRPVAVAFKGLACLAGCPRLGVTNPLPGRVAAISAMTSGGPILWLANLTDKPVSALLRGPHATRILMIDFEGLAASRADLVPETNLPTGPVKLDGYAVCRIR